MQTDLKRWNKRFNDKAMTPPSVPGFIQESENELIPGTVLDIASGDGAASLHLAAKGFQVTAIDISTIALERLRHFAQQQGLSITTHPIDLDEPADLSRIGEYDNIVIAHFKPAPEYWQLFAKLLKPGGKLLISTFNLTHHLENGFSKRFCLDANELKNINESLVIEHYESVNRNGDFMDDYRFRRI